MSIIPAVVPTTDTKEVVYLGNVAVPDVPMYRVTEQYVTVPLGSVTIDRSYENFIDYKARAYIFLPYLGEKELNIDDVMGATLTLTYNIDVLSGACAVLLHVNNPSAPTPIDAVLYQWEGNVITHIPITTSQWNISIGQVATAIGSMAVGGSLGGIGAGAIMASSGLSPRVSTTGSITANSGLVGMQRPYIVLNIPRPATPTNYTAYAGRATSKVSKLGELNGTVHVEDIHLTGIPATTDELAELETLLKDGVTI